MLFLSFLISLLYSPNFLIWTTFSTAILFGIILPLIFLYQRAKFRHIKNQRASESKNRTQVGLFHPYCSAGGGGEKVLWVALQILQKTYPDADFWIYTGDLEFTPTEILDKVARNLNVDISPSNVRFVYLTRRRWVEGAQYPYFTLLGQALGSLYLGIEALGQVNPDIFIDTTGFTFTLPLFKYLGGAKVGCYVHYPTITSDMIRRVSNRQAMYNNRSIIARSPIFTYAKLLYYRFFAWFYCLAGQCSDITLVNSTFTLDHLSGLWKRPLHLVYPPCDVTHLKKIERQSAPPVAPVRIVSLAQFRPEKDHPVQLQMMYELRELLRPNDLFESLQVTLVLCGSCRNSDDAARVKALQDLTRYLSLEHNVEFKINLTYEEVLEQMSSAHIGIHTMIDEHFGIGVVEMMAVGLICVAHRSGGPMLDIIETSEGSRLGFLARTPEEYAQVVKYIVSTADRGEIGRIRERARASVDRFSTGKFQDEILRAFEPIFK